MKETLSANVGASQKIETTINVGASQMLEANINAGGGSGISKEYDPTVPQHVKNITQEDINKWNNNTSEEDTGWIDLKPLQGEWAFLQIRKIDKEVFVRGYATSYAWSNETKIIANVPEEFKPSYNVYNFSMVSGARTGRVGMNYLGVLFCDWARNLNDGSNFSNATWHQFSFSYFLD